MFVSEFPVLAAAVSMITVPVTASDFAAREFVTRDTLPHFEVGTGSPHLDSVAAVLIARGAASTGVTSADPTCQRPGGR